MAGDPQKFPVIITRCDALVLALLFVVALFHSSTTWPLPFLLPFQSVVWTLTPAHARAREDQRLPPPPPRLHASVMTCSIVIYVRHRRILAPFNSRHALRIRVRLPAPSRSYRPFVKAACRPAQAPRRIRAAKYAIIARASPIT